MIAKSDLQHIGKWLQKLRRSTAAGKDDVTAEQLADYTMWLVQDFPLAVFNDASAKSIADAGEFFPKWAILRAHLVEWHDRHPAVPRITAPIPDALQQRMDELSDSAAYFRRIAEERAEARADWSDPVKVRSSASKIGNDRKMQRYFAGLIKKHAPENLDQVHPDWKS